MKFLKKIRYGLGKTRIPYVLLAILCGIGIWFSVGAINHDNTQVNSYLRKQHTENVAKMNNDQHEIFKNRAQLNALSDEHNADLMQGMFNRMMRMQKQKHPKRLIQDPKYMHMTSEMMSVDDKDNNRINSLQHKINRLRPKIKFEHNHESITNLMNHGASPIYNKMVQSAFGFLVLMIMELYFITYIFKFKDFKLAKWRHSVEDAKRARWIAEYGDDAGFKQAEQNESNEIAEESEDKK